MLDKGVFFQAPIDGLVEDPDGQGSTDGFSATIGGSPFVPIGVATSESVNFISISGSSTSTTLSIRVPVDVGVGNYSLPAAGFLATYSEGAVTETATVGNISVITHDIVGKTMSGSFSFNTAGQVVQDGQFNISY